MSDVLRLSFGVRPRGMCLAERVWEPHLPRALAGLDPEALGGWYVTEDQGATLGVFPISQRLPALPDPVRRGRGATRVTLRPRAATC